MVDLRVCIAPGDRRAALIRDARAGLVDPPRSLPPVWFYDERGSGLFDQITRLDEYYPTRAERAILAERAAEIVEISKVDTLVELGSGTSEKTRLLLDAMTGADQLRHFVPFDVSEAILRSAAHDINRSYQIPVTAVVGDFHSHLDVIPREGRRLVAFLGGTIGNLAPAQRSRFLVDLEMNMDDGDWLLLGTDLEKDVNRLVAAYDDASGVTAEFNRNVLLVLNSELGADFDPAAFDHVALWNEKERWIEMRLRARRAHDVAIKDLDVVLELEKGEDLLTEISAKFTRERVERELSEASFILEHSWTDDRGDFLVSLARPYC